ncbi:MAG: hypothetical protein QOI20_1408 [Acidimicrobiaceae bacterium]|jgi:hypothetical protein|nr:hypothetical protein [Acidimicrobiaceae bacterium]
MPVTRPTTAEVLRAIIDLLDEAAAAENASAPAALVRIDRLPATADDEVQFSLQRLEPGQHPLAVLRGFVAPPTWAGIGVVAGGRCQSMDDPSRVGRARVIVVLARDGTMASGLRVDGDPMVVDVAPAGGTVIGDIPLALCRALGVPVVTGPTPGLPDSPQGDTG